jgi:hypothetical protein
MEMKTKKHENIALFITTAMLGVFVAILIYWVVAGYDNEGAKLTLEKAGYTEIETHGRAWFACGRDDFFSTKFTAKNTNDVLIDGAVCRGLFWKAATVRF